MWDKLRRLPPRTIILISAAVLLLSAVIWILGPGARWVVDLDVNLTKLDDKDIAAAADAVRGRALAIATGLIALMAVYYTAQRFAPRQRSSTHSTHVGTHVGVDRAGAGDRPLHQSDPAASATPAICTSPAYGGIYTLEQDRPRRRTRPQHGAGDSALLPLCGITLRLPILNNQQRKEKERSQRRCLA